MVTAIGQLNLTATVTTIKVRVNQNTRGLAGISSEHPARRGLSPRHIRAACPPKNTTHSYLSFATGRVKIFKGTGLLMRESAQKYF